MTIHIDEWPDPLWARALIRLGNATERMAATIERLYGKPIERGNFVPTCRQLVQDLIDFALALVAGRALSRAKHNAAQAEYVRSAALLLHSIPSSSVVRQIF